WREVGIDTIIRNETPRVFFGQTLDRRNFGALALFAWLSAPEQVPRSTLHSEEIPSEGNGWRGQNYTGFSDPVMDELLEEIERELDPKARQVLWQQLQQIYAEELPALPLFWRASPQVIPSWLEGVRPTGHMVSASMGVEEWRRADGLRDMSRFLLQRLIEGLLVLWLMSFRVYLLIGLMPGDPIDIMISADPNLTAADAQRLREVYGLDQPLLSRYWTWLTSTLSGDLGYSRLFNRPVEVILIPRLGNTLLLMSCALFLALAIALPLGVAAARRPGSLLDLLVNFGAFAGASLPSFWLAILLILLFAVTLGWLPAG